MQFPFSIDEAIDIDSQGFAVYDARGTHSHPQRRHVNTGIAKLAAILNQMGEASAKAQGLGATITTFERINGTDNRVYLKAEKNRVLGFLKVGQRQLFHHDMIGTMKQIRPLCVLDFYCHESVQRLGVGKQLFDKMLQCEKVLPQALAYDRPSLKLLSFMKKHYNLSRYVPQNNNFVIYDEYFVEQYDKRKNLPSKFEELPLISSEKGSLQAESGRQQVEKQTEQGKKVQTRNFSTYAMSILQQPSVQNHHYQPTDKTQHTTYNNVRPDLTQVQPQHLKTYGSNNTNNFYAPIQYSTLQINQANSPQHYFNIGNPITQQVQSVARTIAFQTPQFQSQSGSYNNSDSNTNSREEQKKAEKSVQDQQQTLKLHSSVQQATQQIGNREEQLQSQIAKTEADIQRLSQQIAQLGGKSAKDDRKLRNAQYDGYLQKKRH